MKGKIITQKFKILRLILAAILLLSSLASCGAVEDGTHMDETDADLPEETQAEDPDEQTLDELIESFLPALETAELTNWKTKLQITEYTDENYQKDNPLVGIRLRAPSRETVSAYIEARKQFDGEIISQYQAERTLKHRLAEKFKEQYITDKEFFVDDGLDETIFVYASAEDMEYYASCNQVSAFVSPDGYFFDEGTKPSRSFGYNLLPWETYFLIQKDGDFYSSKVTYRYRRNFPCTPCEGKEYINADRFALKGVCAIPMIKIDSADELAQSISPLALYGDDARKDLLASYDDTFFETKSLFFLSITEPSGSISHTVQSVRVIDDTFYVVIEQHVPELGTADMGYWGFIFEVEKADIEGCTVFEAWMNEE